ncbi:MAG: AraC family transcriptional regulator [Pseudomonadota bacterium]|nr:MAG: AraC family transcriptional regulator [Pseudomonadota bacterium]
MATTQAQDTTPAQPGQYGDLPAQIQSLKNDVLELNRNLTVLEKDFLAPASTRVTVFLSMDTNETFDLGSVELRLNNKVVATHLYTERELRALQRGGAPRLFEGALPPGEHELVAYFRGAGEDNRDYRRGLTKSFEKGTRPQYLEIQIFNVKTKRQPEIDLKVWE